MIDTVRALTTTPQPAEPRGVVLLLHGGAEHGLDEVGPRSGALWRSRWMLDHVGGHFVRAGYAAALLRFSIRGWNAGVGAEPSPVPDARWALDLLRDRYGDVPVVLLGHSMGARTALHVADDPSVVGVVGLAPWFPAVEDVRTLAGIHLVAAHGRRDRITSATQTRRLLARAEGIAASVRFVDMGPLGHYMLTHIRRWNRVAVDRTLGILDAH